MSKLVKGGLILEGGANRGIFTAGVLDYLMEQDCYLSYVVGVSAGSCNATGYVSHQKGRMKACMIHNDPQESYISLRNMVKQKSLYNMDLIFDKYPNDLYPFDYDAYFASEIESETVVTNCLTGKPEYLNEHKDRIKLMNICRASSSIALAAPMVLVNGVPYLDGGYTDSIPILRSLRKGNKKNVVILTRNKGYRKTLSRRMRSLYRSYFKKYPQLARAICRRPQVYNRAIEYVEKWEEQGHIFVIRPEQKAISSVEMETGKLEDFYQHGYQLMKEKYDAMMAFLKDEGEQNENKA